MLLSPPCPAGGLAHCLELSGGSPEEWGVFLACTPKRRLPEKGGACPAHAMCHAGLGWSAWAAAGRGMAVWAGHAPQSPDALTVPVGPQHLPGKQLGEGPRPVYCRE